MKSYQIRFSTLVHRLICSGFTFGLVLVFFGCKEDEDTEKPQVIISKPFENQMIFSVDTFLVEATITDNEQVTSVEVDFVDENFNSVIDKQRYEAFGSSFNFSVNFELNAPSLNSGIYYIVVRGSDGINSTQAFRKVNLAEIPLELEQTFVVTSAFNNVKVFTGLQGPDWLERLSLFTDYAGAALNYQDDILAIAGGEVGDCVFYDTEEFNVVNTIPGFGGLSLPFFLGVKYQPETREFALLLREPRLRTFDKWGQPVNAFNLVDNHLPLSVYDLGNRYHLCEKPISSPNHIFTSYARPGLLMSSLFVEGPVRGVFRKSENELFVWVDAPDQVQLRILNTAGNLFSSPYERNGEQLHDVVALSTSTFVIATSAGIFRYNFGNGGTVVLNSSIIAEKLFYERISGTIYAISGNEMHRLTPEGALMQTNVFAQQVRHVAFDYNR